MKLKPVRLTALLIVVLTLVMLSGCARAPKGGPIVAVRAFTVELTLAGPINNAVHYYTAIDVDGGITGPVPVFPGIIPGQGWVTGAATHYVEYTGGQFTLYEFLPKGQFQNAVRIGAPIRSSAQGNTLSFTIDLNDIAATGQLINVNFITVDDPLGQHRTIDALLVGSASVFPVDITRDDTFNNARLGDAEQPNDLLNENGTGVLTTDTTRSLDMIPGWRIDIDI